jgi:hypothetical protein
LQTLWGRNDDVNGCGFGLIPDGWSALIGIGARRATLGTGKRREIPGKLFKLFRNAAIGVKYGPSIVLGENIMVLCPVALAVGCRKCPIFNVCPVKSVIGDYKPEDDAKEKSAGSGGKKKK